MFHTFQKPSKLSSTFKKIPHYPITVEDLNCPDPRAIRSLILLMDQAAVNGGAAAHWGGPAALAEITSVLLSHLFQKTKKNWFEEYNLINDIGHAENVFYAARALFEHAGITISELLKFRSMDSRLTGHGESHLFPESVLMSNGPLSSAFAQSQGLAMADKLLENNRTTICFLSDGALMEGEAKEAMTAIPGLAAKGKCNPYLLLFSYNNTKLSGRISLDSYSMAPTVDAFATLGWEVFHCHTPHDIESCNKSFQEALEKCHENPTKPVVLILHTIKGQGLTKTVSSPSGGHGFPLKKHDPELIPSLTEIWNGDITKIPKPFTDMAEKLLEQLPKSSVNPLDVLEGKREKIQAGFGRGSIIARQKNYPVIAISSDLQSSTGLAPFHKEFPQYSFDLGVSESNMISSAAGCAKFGFIPLVDTFAAFGVTKGNLPLIMSSLSQAPVIGIFSHVGFQDAADGASHQSLTYFSALSSIPNMDIISPINSKEAEEVLLLAIDQLAHSHSQTQTQATQNEHGKSKIFFTGREDALLESNPLFASMGPLIWGKPRVVHQGNAGILVSNGNIFEEAILAQLELKKSNQDWTLINHLFLNSCDKSFWKEQLEKNQGKIIYIEDHQIQGGIGSYLLNSLNQQGLSPIIKKFETMGIDGHFGQSAYSARQLYDKHKISSAHIAKKALGMIV